MSDWKPIDTAPKYTAIMLGKWSYDDEIWFWQASGCFEEDGMWIDFTDSFHDAALYHEATHWAPILAPPTT